MKIFFVKLNKKLNKVILIFLAITTITFVLFQNFTNQSNVVSVDPNQSLSAMAFVERALMDMNQVNFDPQGNALMVAYTFGLATISSVYAGNYNASSFAANGTIFALNKFDHYNIGNTAVNANDTRLAVEMRRAVLPFTNSFVLTNQPYSIPLGERIQLSAVPGILSIDSLNENGQVVFSRRYDDFSIHQLKNSIIAVFNKAKTIDPNIYKKIEEFENDPSDTRDNVSQIPDIVMGEQLKDGTISLQDMVDYHVIKPYDQPNFNDIAAFKFDENGEPVYSKITFQSKKSFDPSYYNPPTNPTQTTIINRDPYDNTQAYDYYKGSPVTVGGQSTDTPGNDYLDHDIPVVDSVGTGTGNTSSGSTTDAGSTSDGGFTDSSSTSNGQSNGGDTGTRGGF